MTRKKPEQKSETPAQGPSRREILRRLGLSFGGLVLPGGWPWLTACTPTPSKSKADPAAPASAELTNGGDKKFLFVFSAMGGASINDSFLAIRQSETKNAATLNTFPDGWVSQTANGELRAVDLVMDSIGPLPFALKTKQSQFLAKYHKDLLVATVAGTTVAHPVGQVRSVTGHDAWNGRTLQEAVAAHYGGDLLIPNVNMATVGFAEPGKDPATPTFALAEQVADPAFFLFGLHGYKGIVGAPQDELMRIAREVRDQELEPHSIFARTFERNSQVIDWRRYRKLQPSLEQLDLINRLNAYEETKDFPFSNFGLSTHPRGELLRKMFPDLGADTLQNQTLLAYLLVTQGISCAVTFGLGMNVTVDGSDIDHPMITNTPTGFDYSHNAHRGTQALLWQRTLDTIDRLITLLKATEYRQGESYWEHSLIYIATEFGRDKKREAGLTEFPTGHDLNNGVVIISPLVNGGRVLGGIDKDTLLTHGFDPETGEPTPGKDMTERDIYAGILHTMKVDTKGSGLPDMKAMRRKA